MISRRSFVTHTLTVASIASALPLAGCGEESGSVDVAELMKPGALPDKWMGKADAPVTIVEYASLDCPHCAAFHKNVLPHLKSAYIDTGKVRLIVREFPLRLAAAAAAVLSRCAPEDKYFEMHTLFFESQQTWALSESPSDALFALVKQAGFTREAFETCLKDQKLLDAVTATRTRAEKDFKVSATPTFFINGKKADDFHTVAEVDKTLSSLVKV